MTAAPSSGAPRRFDVITLFPEMFEALTGHGITRRAQARGLYEIGFHNPRDWANNTHKTIDDRPYGGGPGMVMLPGPLECAINAARKTAPHDAPVIYLSPQGRRLDHARVIELSQLSGLILLCGRYEGIDQRVIDRHVDHEISLGDFVLSGGELPAMVLLDALIRQMPGALNDADSAQEDSFADGLLDCPHYTRPEVHDGTPVPPVLLSGDHAKIRRWRLKQSLGLTAERRPDLLEKRALNKEEQNLLEEYRRERHNAGLSREHPSDTCGDTSS